MVSVNSVFHVTVLCSALFVACFATPTSRIVDGEEAGANAFPYAVSVRVNDAHVCGGSIIAQSFILTAAHCISELGTNPIESSRISIRAGSTNPYAGGKLLYVAETFIHESYGSFLYDVALLKLINPLELGPRIAIIPLAESDDSISPGDVVTVAGWGGSTSKGPITYKLQFGVASVISSDDCEKSIAFGYACTLCLESEPGKGICTGDAGSPAVHNNELVGVGNFVVGTCGTKYPDVFAKASFFKDWIDNIVNAS